MHDGPALQRIGPTPVCGHPGYHIQVTTLDSGSYGSIGSDIDKTLHVTAWDANGKEVPALGRGGLIGDTDAFLKTVVTTSNEIGTEFGARNPIASSLDTEFFSSETLPQRLPGLVGRGATHGSADSPMTRSANVLRQDFRALQSNPGPAYQTIAKIAARVIGRVVEQDVLLQQRIDDLARNRQNLERLSATERRAHYLQEMVTSIHAPAVVLAEEGGRLVTRAIDVIEFLERNNLAIRYPADMAAANALGDREKLAHKVYHVIDDQGRFHADQYDICRSDIAKYGTRSKHDTAMMVFADDPSKPAKSGESNRRFGPAGYKARVGVEPASQPARVHRRGPSLAVRARPRAPARERRHHTRGAPADRHRHGPLLGLEHGQRDADGADPVRPDPIRPNPVPSDPRTGDPVRSDPTRRDPPGREPPGIGGAIDPNRHDPAGPDVAALIREWLSVAEPVENASGASFRYDRWGRLIGSATAGMGRTVGQAPPPEGGGAPEESAWRLRAKLDSIRRVPRSRGSDGGRESRPPH